MKLFARILSHGFALALVALLAIGLIYRGELFPGLELPAFLQPGGSGENVASAEKNAPLPHEATPAPADMLMEEPSITPPPVAVVTGQAPMNAGPAPAAPEAGSRAEPPAEVAEQTVNTAAPGAQQTREESPEEQPAPESVAPPVVVPSHGATQTVAPAELSGGAPVEMPEPVTGAAPTPSAAEQSAAVAEEMPPAAPESMPGIAAEEPPSAPDEATGAAAAMTQDNEPAGQPQDVTQAPAATPGNVQNTAPAAGAAEQPESAAAEPGGEAGTAVPAAGETSSYRLLAAAREAYWLRDYDKAEQNYRALIALDPANPDGYGELGNMYFSQGDWEQAAAAYYEAGTRLVDEGLIDHAVQLVEVIRGLNGSQATLLEEKINAALQADN